MLFPCIHAPPLQHSNTPHSPAPTIPRHPLDELSTNEFPSLSLNVTNVPHGSFLGGASKSTPRAESSPYVCSTSSQQYEIPENEPMRPSCPSGVNRVTRVSALGIRSSIQRCLPLNGWSVMIVKPSFSV